MPRRKKIFLARLAMLLLCALCGASAFAQVRPELKILGANGDSPFMWARLTLTNTTGYPLDTQIVLQDIYGGGGECTIDGEKIEPGAVRVMDLPLPFQNGVSVSVSDSRGGQMGASANGEDKHFVNIAEVQSFAPESALQSFSRTAATDGTLQVDTRRFGGGSPSSSANFFTQIEPANLPADWRCYTPLNGVFVQDFAWRRMEPAPKQAIMNWVRLGGVLSVYGGDRDEAVKEMSGTIIYTRDSPIETAQTRKEASTRPPWMEFGNKDSGHFRNFPFLVAQGGGKGGGLALATLFCVLVGPVNLWQCRRRKRIRLMLLTVPALSICFCLLMTIYFIASQGFMRRGGTVSVTVLDENSKAAFTHGFHSLNSGLYPSGGFRFAGDTAFVPPRRDWNDEAFRMDIGSGTNLTDGYFKPTINFNYYTLAPRSTRERAIFDFAAGAATNGFEAPMKALFVKKGSQIWKAGAIAPGARATMQSTMTVQGEGGVALVNAASEAMGDPDVAAFIRQEALRCLPQLDDPDRTYYLAVLGGKAPDAASAGVNINHGQDCHILIGIAADAAGADTGDRNPGANDAGGKNLGGGL